MKNKVIDTKDKYILSFKLADTPFIDGEWFEANLSFKSEGTYKGDFEITDSMIDDFVTNFKLGVVRRWKDKNEHFRLKINYNHYYETKAGWIIDVEARDKMLSTGQMVRSLWLKPEYLPDAVEAKKKGYYEYFSIEYSTNYWDDQNQQSYKNVLTGGALTDDPFTMELEPIALSNIIKMRDEKKKSVIEPTITKEEYNMEGLLKALKAAGIELSVNATESEIVLKFNEIFKANEKLTADVKVKSDEVTKLTTELSTANESLSVATKSVEEFNEFKLKTETEAIVELKALAIKGEKYSKAECEDDGAFGEIVSALGYEKAKLHLEKAPARFSEKKVILSEGEVDLNDDATYAKELKRVAKDEKISRQAADVKLRLVKAKQNNKEVK